MGYQVVKHGNRAVSSNAAAPTRKGSASIWTSTQPKWAKSCDQNFVFLFAQRSTCFRNIAPIRNELGIRTCSTCSAPDQPSRASCWAWLTIS
ncbi:MAG: hypothetical protein ACLRWP_20275 [Bilophila wadsworthia]